MEALVLFLMLVLTANAVYSYRRHKKFLKAVNLAIAGDGEKRLSVKKGMWSRFEAAADSCWTACLEVFRPVTGRIKAGWAYVSAVLKLDDTMIALAFLKLMFSLLISLSLNDWWSLSGSDAVVESCSAPAVGECFSFCSDILVVNLAVTDDDYSFQDDYLGALPSVNFTSHLSDSSYCVADVTGQCAYRYWLIFKLVPLLMHVLIIVLQYTFLKLYGTFTPQKRQFDAVIAYMYPEMLGATVLSEDRSSGVESDQSSCERSTSLSSGAVINSGIHASVNAVPWADRSRAALLEELTHPRLFGIFSFLEVLTMGYVWGELAYPSTYCGAARPLSLYYYPLLMTMTHILGFSMYVATKLRAQKRYTEAALVLLNVPLTATYLWVSVYLAASFVWGPVEECGKAVFVRMWAIRGRDGSLGVDRCDGLGTGDTVTMNPLSASAEPDVESGDKGAIALVSLPATPVPTQTTVG